MSGRPNGAHSAWAADAANSESLREQARRPICRRLTNTREGVHKGEIEGGVDLSPIGRGIVDVQFADEMVRLTGREGEGFGGGATGVLQALPIQPNCVGEVTGITEVDHRAVLERVVGAGEGF